MKLQLGLRLTDLDTILTFMDVSSVLVALTRLKSLENLGAVLTRKGMYLSFVLVQGRSLTKRCIAAITLEVVIREVMLISCSLRSKSLSTPGALECGGGAQVYSLEV
jgi:hypothetical protein